MALDINLRGAASGTGAEVDATNRLKVILPDGSVPAPQSPPMRQAHKPPQSRRRANLAQANTMLRSLPIPQHCFARAQSPRRPRFMKQPALMRSLRFGKVNSN